MNDSGGTCFGVMTSNFKKINLGQNFKNAYLSCHSWSYSFTFDTENSLHFQLSYSDIFNMNIFHCDLMNFLKVLRSWPQNKYHQSL